MREREWELEGYKRARLLRAQLELGTAPVGDAMYQILEQQNLLVLGKPWPSANLSGAFFRVSETSAFVFINHARSLGHQRFTAAHELSHFLYDTDVDNKVESVSEAGTSRDPREIAANAFADEFLMPAMSPRIRDAEREIVRTGPSMELLIHLQQHFGVSYRALARKLWKLNLLTESQWHSLRDVPHLSRRTLDLGYNKDLLMPLETHYVSPDYVALACSLYREGGISESRLEDVLADVGRDLESLGLANDDEAGFIDVSERAPGGGPEPA